MLAAFGDEDEVGGMGAGGGLAAVAMEWRWLGVAALAQLRLKSSLRDRTAGFAVGGAGVEEAELFADGTVILSSSLSRPLFAIRSVVMGGGFSSRGVASSSSSSSGEGVRLLDSLQIQFLTRKDRVVRFPVIDESVHWYKPKLRLESQAKSTVTNTKHTYSFFGQH